MVSSIVPLEFAFKTVNNLDIYLDVYVPPSAAKSSPAPVVLWWHGGGLLQGTRKGVPPNLVKMSQETNIAFVSADYRFAPQTPLPLILEDTSDAVTFVRTKLPSLLYDRIDPSKLCVSGGSAGGWLALLAGIPSGIGALNPPPTCIAAMYPITDSDVPFFNTPQHPVSYWKTIIPDIAVEEHLNPSSPALVNSDLTAPRAICYHYMVQEGILSKLLFQNIDQCTTDEYRFSRPANYAINSRIVAAHKRGLSIPPVYLTQGTIDDKVDNKAALQTFQVLESVDATVVYEEREGCDHLFDQRSDEDMKNLHVFIQEHLLSVVPPKFKSLKIGIIGGGLSGLATAISLRRSGHIVEVHESTEDFSTDVGASCSTAANATAWLKSWEIDWSSAEPISLQRLTMKKWDDGSLINEFSMTDYVDKWGQPYLMFDRQDLHALLLSEATSLNGNGSPAVIHMGSKVTAIDFNTSEITAVNGVKKYDLLLACDGVNSFVRKQMLPNEDIPESASGTCIKFNVAVANAIAHGHKDFTVSEGINFWLGPENKKIVLSPTRGKKMMSFYCFVPATKTLTNTGREGFHLPPMAVGDAKYHLAGLDPECLSLVEHAEDIRQWKLNAQKPLSTWIKGTVGLVGDAAHYMMPDQSQAPSTVIEDAAALGLIFSKDHPEFTTNRDGILHGLKTYEALRKARATRVQNASAKARLDVRERIGFSDMAAPPGGWRGVAEGKLTINELNSYDMRGHLSDIIAGLT